MDDADLDAQLAQLAQHFADTAFSLRVILELRASADQVCQRRAGRIWA